MKYLYVLLYLPLFLFAQTDWSDAKRVSGIYWCNQSAITVDNNGALTAVWCKETDIGKDYYSNVYFSRSTNGGLSWSNESKITDYSTGRIYQLRAVTDSNNNVHILFAKGYTSTIFIYKVFDGISWTDDEIIDFTMFTNHRLGIDSKDKLFSTWTIVRTTYYMYNDLQNDSVSWSEPAIIDTTTDIMTNDFAFDKSDNLYAINKVYKYDSLSYGPFYSQYNNTENQWEDFEEIYNYQDSNIGCTIAVSESDTLYTNISVGSSTNNNVNYIFKKHLDDTLWSSPIQTGSFNNKWERKMFIDKKNIVHIFEVNIHSDWSSEINHTFGKGSSWKTETIHYDPDYSIFYFDVKRTVFDDYDQYYVLYYKGQYKSGMVNFQTKQISTSIEEVNIPSETNLSQNYPNPFNPTTKIWYTLKEAGNVNLSVFNSKGELAQTLFEGKEGKGIHSINFDASRLNSGVYFYKLTTNTDSQTRKMLFLR